MGGRNKSRGQNRFGLPTSGGNNQEAREKKRDKKREKSFGIWGKKGREGFRDKLRNVERCGGEIKTEGKEMEERIKIALKTKIKKGRK